MQDGNEQLDQAKKHQKGSTSRLCWILIILSVIVVGIVPLPVFYL